MKKEYNFSKGKRGPVVSTPLGKTRITIRLDNEILNWFKKKVNDAGGGNYQTLINEALRIHLKNEEQSMEKLLRKVIREELKNTKKEDAA